MRIAAYYVQLGVMYFQPIPDHLKTDAEILAWAERDMPQNKVEAFALFGGSILRGRESDVMFNTRLSISRGGEEKAETTEKANVQSTH